MADLISDSEKQDILRELSQKVGLSNCDQATIIGDTFSMPCGDGRLFSGSLKNILQASPGTVEIDTGRRRPQVSYTWVNKPGECSKECGGTRIDDYECQNEAGDAVQSNLCAAVKPDQKTIACDPCKEDFWDKLSKQEWFWPAVITTSAFFGFCFVAFLTRYIFFWWL